MAGFRNDKNRNEFINFIQQSRHDTYDFISPHKVDLYGKSVFITGASKGVGRETAIRFAMAGCCEIAVAARSDMSSLEAEIKEAARKAGRTREPKVLSFKLDVTSEDSVKAAADTVAAEFGGKLDALVNNAGYLPEWVPVADSPASEWWMAYEVNVRGVFLCSKFFMPLLLKSETKTNIITTSIGALGKEYGASAYQSSKFAVCRLAEFLASDYRDQGLVCFTIHPGGVKTELANAMPDWMLDVLIDEPQLPADTTVWLVSERRPWLSGRIVSSVWDMEQLEARKDEIVKGDLLKFRVAVTGYLEQEPA
ncbi:NAD(P)-binding protein [Hypoxylon sp. FL1284]|nr:NAD(P)-binding protein [Hypoxylon sp. FL1284]